MKFNKLNVLLLIVTALLSSCTVDKSLVTTVTGKDGKDGKDGYTTYLTTEAVMPGQVCPTGGVKLVPYTDTNRNEVLDLGEATALAVSTVCNGATGAQGQQGMQGLPGPQGVQGIQGIPGVQGVAGPKGANGEQGVQGVQGSAGTQGIPGTPGAQGLVGQQGSPGIQGQQGAPGVQGLPGVNGTNGINGSSGSGGIYVIQLCPGDNATFPEQGFVIDNNIYAVYYGVVNGTLNSFLARLSSGSYQTTNGTACNFSVSYPNGAPAINGTSLINPRSGLTCQVYDSQSIDRSSGMNRILTNATPKFSLKIDQLDIPDMSASLGFPKFSAAQNALLGDEDYVLDCNGVIEVPKTQTYTITTLSDDGSNTYIDNALVISMDQLQAPTSKSVTVFLTKGSHKVNVTYFQGLLSQIALSLFWSAPEFATQIIPNSVLSH